MKTAVVIPNWNGADMIAEALTSLERQTYKSEIVVVDNGSVDDSVKIITEQFPKVTLIKLAHNTGFDGGVNTGIKHALENNADAVALFNNDAIADAHWLENLVRAMEADEKRGIVTGKLLRTDKKYFDSTGDFYSVWGLPFPRGRNQADTGQYDKAEEVFSATGGATLYRAKLFQEIGIFDERFFAYIEDIDISFRARLSGWTVWYEPTAVAYHHISATSSKLGSFSRYHWAKNSLITYTKDMPGLLFWKYLPLFTLQTVRFGISSTLRGELWVYLRGTGAFLLLLSGVLKDRRHIQKHRKITTREVDALLYHGRPPRIPPISES
jgi:GT2 family glycosyltransferase